MTIPQLMAQLALYDKAIVKLDEQIAKVDADIAELRNTGTKGPV